MNAMPLHELWEKLFPPERRWLAWLIMLALLAQLAIFTVLKIKPVAPAGARPPLLQAATLTVAAAPPARGGWLDWRDSSAPLLPRGPLPPLPVSGRRELPPPPPLPPLSLTDRAPAAALISRLPSIVQQAREALTVFQPVPKEAQIETPPRLSGTMVEITGDLAGRQVARKTDLPQPTIDRNLQVTVCLLAVNASGLVENVMVDNSCDDAEVDQLAVRELGRWQFAPNPDVPLQWGRAMVYWHFKGKPAATTGGNP
ncbi:MAG: hypothetical protein LBK76_04825 [Verrucomicrobiales bacterium]|jgi:hypothetical protein|nr:hypothetical protein [Verrucomicrobiales bacterium]